MKKLFVLISAMLCIMLLAFSASAEENVVYVASGGTGDGSSVESPLGTLVDAFTAVGETGGTVVLTSDLTIGAAVNLPDHTGKVVLTSVYGGVDYRATNDAALRYTASARLVLGGPTEIDYFDIEIDSGANGGAVLAADFNDLKIGYNVDISYNYTVSGVKMYVIGGPNNDKTGNTLDEGESCTIEIYSGAYEQVDAFSRSVANMAHYGTVYMTLGGNASARLCYMGAITTGATGGSCELTLKENSKATWLYLSGNAGGMNGSVTVNVKDKATVTSIDRYADSLFPNGTKTINLYGDAYTVPASLETYFTTVNVIEEEVEEPDVPVVNLDTAYVAQGGTGNGSTADAPIGTLVDAVTVLGDDGGTVVVVGDTTISALTELPEHTGTVTITSVYGGVDYRTTNSAALRYTASARIVLGGDTVIDDLNIEIDQGASSGAVLAADFHNLKVGYGVEIIHNYTLTSLPSRMYIIGGSNNDANGNGLAEGEVCNIEIYSGDYMQIAAFSRGTSNKAHYGTVNLTIGGDVTSYETYLGAITTGASGGTVNLELKENAKLNNQGLFLSGNSGGMNGDVTVTVRDNAVITSIGQYSASLHNGTKTINVYGEAVTVPSSLDTYFDVVNIYIPKDSVTITESFDVANIVSVAADNNAITADITKGDNGITFEYTEALENFTLSVTVKGDGYTVYEYTVTETNDVASATLAGTKTYAGDVIYIGATDGNGLTPETPVSTINKAYEMLVGNSGTFVICGEVTMGAAIVAPAHTGTLTVTSVYGGTDYRTSGAKLVCATSIGWQLGGDTVFENLTFDITTSAVISAAFNPLTFDEGIEVINDYENADSNGLYLIGGHNKGVNTLAEYPDDTSITVRSGHIRCIIGFSRYSGARVHTGTATINVEGDAYVRYVFGGAAQDNATSKDTFINVKDQAIVENLYTGGSANTNFTTGKVIIDVTELNGGDIYEFDTVSIRTSDGKVELHYDPRTVANGITTMASMAQFDVLSLCDLAGEHTFGETYANPFGGGLTAHTCKICEYTCLIEEAPAKVAEKVVFVADGGFGNGVNPLHPFGNLEDAFNALGKDGGTVVLIGECTLPVNLEWKFGASHVSFQEPTHTGEVLVTSLYGDVDYRDAGAKLIFDGNMHYRLSGPTTFDSIVFDTVGNPTTNLIAARYNPLVFGEDCKMNKTSADGYNLWVVGGYQYFRYTDFIGVEVEDRYLDMVTPARPKAWDWQPDDLVEFTYTSGSGKTHTVTLQKDAAAAFEQMFKDMEAEGLYVPYPSWPFRSAHTQYGIFSDSVGNQRVNGKDFDTAYLAIARSASPAGNSEHQLGFAFDIYDERLEETYGAGKAHEHYHDTPEWQWIVENGPKYGLIHRFLKGKSEVTGFIYEAWHFRYVGVEHAMAIAETDYCLEEYVAEQMGMFDQNSSVTILSGDFYQVMGGSRGCDYLTFTGTNHVTVGENANVTNLVDVDGEVGEIITPTMGDANGDETVNLLDFIRVFKYTVDSTVKISVEAADMNSDSVVDIKDALLILKAVVNG
ncbi:MAG: D-alanyl-D-alanine carboxypeptidase family protein [Clostridia bacterium]|nr:D-alanyl-D-alanine carboxypeptidase family protein [Clostridia bacterium]